MRARASYIDNRQNNIVRSVDDRRNSHLVLRGVSSPYNKHDALERRATFSLRSVICHTLNGHTMFTQARARAGACNPSLLSRCRRTFDPQKVRREIPLMNNNGKGREVPGKQRCLVSIIIYYPLYTIYIYNSASERREITIIYYTYIYTYNQPCLFIVQLYIVFIVKRLIVMVSATEN